MMDNCVHLAQYSGTTYFRNTSGHWVVYEVSSPGLIYIPLSHFVNNRNYREGSRICAEMRSLPIVGVTSAEYGDSFRCANIMPKNKSFFHRVFFLTTAHLTPSVWSNFSFYAVITWCEVTVCLFDIHRVHYRNGLKFPWCTWRWSIHPVLWRVAGNHSLLDSGSARGLILVIGSLVQATPVLNSKVSSAPP